MFNSAPAPHDPAAPANDDAPDPAVARAERRLRLLEEMAEIGMKLLRALEPGVAEAPSEKSPGKTRDPADAFASLSRAVRLTLLLEAKTDEELRDLKEGIVRDRPVDEARAGEKTRKARHEREARLQQLVLGVAVDRCETPEAFENLEAALTERLEYDPVYFDCLARPLRENVERLCKDLCLEPDWSRWDGEGWIDDGPPTRSRFSPFNTPSPKPLLDDDGEPLPAPPPLQNRHDLE
jgi:hypothetical protein